MGKKPAVSAATKEKLKDAFWQLYAQKGVDQISVREVTDLAGYNRGTFYLYFKDIYDLLNQIEDSLLNMLPGGADAVKPVQQGEFGCSIEALAQLYEPKRKYMVVLLGEHGDPQFTHKLKKQFISILSDMPKIHNLDELTRQYYLEYCATGLVAMLQLWLKNTPPIPMEDFIFIVHRIMIPAVKSEP